MMSAPAASRLHHTDAAIDDRPNLPRVRLRAGPSSNHVDGAWWPHSRDLTAELPALLEAIVRTVGTIEEISYHRADWIDAPRDRAASTPVAVTEFGELRGTVRVRGSRGSRTILVVPPGTSELDAADLLSAVLAHGPHADAQELLRPVRGLVEAGSGER